MTLFNCNDTQHKLRIKDVHALLDKIIDHASQSLYQPPHWDHEPTAEDEKAEQSYLDYCKDHSNKAERLAQKMIDILFDGRLILLYKDSFTITPQPQSKASQ